MPNIFSIFTAGYFYYKQNIHSLHARQQGSQVSPELWDDQQYSTNKPLSLSLFFSWSDLKILLLLLLPSNPLLPFQVSDLILKYLESKCTSL